MSSERQTGSVEIGQNDNPKNGIMNEINVNICLYLFRKLETCLEAVFLFPCSFILFILLKIEIDRHK